MTYEQFSKEYLDCRKIICSRNFTIEQKDKAIQTIVQIALRLGKNTYRKVKSLVQSLCLEWTMRRRYEEKAGGQK